MSKTEPLSPTPSEATEDAPRQSLWGDLVAAIRGTPQDYTSGPLSRAILLLAIPMVLETSMFSIFAVCDAYFVGRLGPEAVAAVGLAEALRSFVFAIGLGLGMGTAAMVARRIGQQRAEEAARITAQAVGFAIALGVTLGWLGYSLAERLMGWMGAEASLIEVGLGYAQQILGGSGLILLLFVINAAFRGSGDPTLALRALAIANLSNIVLDPILIFGFGPIPAFGVTGAGIATNLGRVLGVLFQLWVLFGGRGRHLRLTPNLMILDLTLLKRLLRVSGVAILQFFIASSSFTGLVFVLTPYSSDALAGYTIAMRVILFVLLPAWGMANASATLVGQSLGAGKPDRAEAAVWRAARYNLYFLGGVTVFLIFASRPLVSIFTDSAVVIDYGTDCLRIVSLGYVAMAFGIAMISAFNGAGDTATPTGIHLLCHWMFKLPLAWFLTWPLGWGPIGVFLSIPLAEIAVALVVAAPFRRGRWKSKII